MIMMMTMTMMMMMYRLVVVLNGWETIHAALVKNSTEFADRPQVYIDKVVNPNAKGSPAVHCS